MSRYRYTDRDLLEEREHYFYSAVEGPGFLAAYRASRLAVLDALPPADPPAAPAGAASFPVDDAAEIVTADLLAALEADPRADWLDRLVQRFEVTKRLHARYDGRLRKPSGSFDDLALYARLAVVLAHKVARTQDLKWLNALLKLNDLLCSRPAGRRGDIAGALARSLAAELDALAALGAFEDRAHG
ncbi:hypothetical protein EU805_15815 [Salipiger sp. IMCC34102]|uniref:hypothetical protein n=1 Tax=Salipiger sp. IMCC34102 TaxID=2510647 RepID=UPI00101DF3EE|nr:hypothetical protein [Salipiger sp. IMCC34102]RYH01064.1 hypothetical protein EU805_15815 [Salipiger sp. IMCC34102]